VNKVYIRGGSIHATATSGLMKTGGWRVFVPTVNPEECSLCKLCYWYCPEGCVELLEETVEINYDYCKGCGICAAECPTGAITIKKEEG